MLVGFLKGAGYILCVLAILAFAAFISAPIVWLFITAIRDFWF